MKLLNQRSGKGIFVLLFVTLAVPLAIVAQKPVKMPKNKYKVQDDVKIGREASNEVEKQFPILNDREAQAYVERVGERLVAAIPPQFRQPAFDYSFKIVNASDINAFALPGGPMYVDRGMIEAAKNEGEMAGVMAHEISHVALRHATAQQTKINSPLNQILGIGAVLGGAVLGGQTGAQVGQMIVAGSFLRYSREYESQADQLGAQIMADAGYDPHDLANMFRTIEQKSGGNGGPEWLSSHPNPGNRYEAINREAERLKISPNPIKVTRDFSRTQERLRAMPPARSMAEIEKSGREGNVPNNGNAGTYSRSVPLPSRTMQNYENGGIRLRVPSNWRDISSDGDLTFAPEGAYGNQGITHGVMIGIYRSRGTNFENTTREYLDTVLKGNTYLRQRDNLSRANVAGRTGLATSLIGRSPVTNRNEVVAVFTAPLRNGDVLYVAEVVPEAEFSTYSNTFRQIVNSIYLND